MGSGGAAGIPTFTLPPLCVTAHTSHTAVSRLQGWLTAHCVSSVCEDQLTFARGLLSPWAVGSLTEPQYNSSLNPSSHASYLTLLSYIIFGLIFRLGPPRPGRRELPRNILSSAHHLEPWVLAPTFSFSHAKGFLPTRSLRILASATGGHRATCLLLARRLLVLPEVRCLSTWVRVISQRCTTTTT